MVADPPEISRWYEQKYLLEAMLGPKKEQKTHKKKSRMGKGLKRPIKEFSKKGVG